MLGITARGNSVAEAKARAYNAVDQIDFDGMHLRRDIADRAIADRVTADPFTDPSTDPSTGR